MANFILFCPQLSPYRGPLRVLGSTKPVIYNVCKVSLKSMHNLGEVGSTKLCRQIDSQTIPVT